MYKKRKKAKKRNRIYKTRNSRGQVFDSSLFQSIENCTRYENQGDEGSVLEVSALDYFSGEAGTNIEISIDAHELFCLIGSLAGLLDNHPEFIVRETEIFHDIIDTILRPKNKLDQLFRSMDFFMRLIPLKVRQELLTHPDFLHEFEQTKKNIPKFPTVN